MIIYFIAAMVACLFLAFSFIQEPPKDKLKKHWDDRSRKWSGK